MPTSGLPFRAVGCGSRSLARLQSAWGEDAAMKRAGLLGREMRPVGTRPVGCWANSLAGGGLLAAAGFSGISRRRLERLASYPLSARNDKTRRSGFLCWRCGSAHINAVCLLAGADLRLQELACRARQNDAAVPFPSGKTPDAWRVSAYAFSKRLGTVCGSYPRRVPGLRAVHGALQRIARLQSP